jgi:hypothetical protein
MNSRMPRRLLTAVAVAIVAGFALAGCVGIPSSGVVKVGGPIKSNGQAPFADLPLGPRKNESKDEMLADFMQAATSPQNSYEIARKYLTKAAAQHWNPAASVLIREGTATQHNRPNDTVDYSVTTKASIDSTGVYSEQSRQSTQSLTFTFTKVSGQWRISGLADGTVVSRSSFTNVFAAQALYFFDPSFKYLVPDVRWFPNGSSVQSRIVSALLGGPAGWLQNGVVVSAFPPGVTLASAVEVGSNAATVDLSANVEATKTIDRQRMLQQLTQSLQKTSAASVPIAMTVRGAPLQGTDSSAGDLPTTALAIDPSPLLGSGKKFGFAPRLQPIGTLTGEIVALNPTAVTVARDQASAAVRASGGVYLISGGKTTLVDSRPALIAPSIDPWGYAWSVPATDASAIEAIGADGVPHQITSAIPSRSTIVALAVSHDGTRVLLYLDTPAGPLLDVAGVVRRAGVPSSLGPLLELPVGSGDPIDATWVDDRSVAALMNSDGLDTVTSYTIGGTSGSPTATGDAVHIVGGSGLENLRVLTSTGQVLQLRSSGWQNTGYTASLLATQQ